MKLLTIANGYANIERIKARPVARISAPRARKIEKKNKTIFIIIKLISPPILNEKIIPGMVLKPQEATESHKSAIKLLFKIKQAEKVKLKIAKKIPPNMVSLSFETKLLIKNITNNIVGTMKDKVLLFFPILI